MLAIADRKFLYLLQFVDWCNLKRGVERLCSETKSTMTPGVSNPIIAIQKELKSYFDGNLKDFKTPINPLGTMFQKLVWDALIRIPYGQTESYANQATMVGRSSAYRAVANANGQNPIAIVIPCHRIINSNGNLGGYGGGSARKKWLLAHEKSKK